MLAVTHIGIPNKGERGSGGSKGRERAIQNTSEEEVMVNVSLDSLSSPMLTSAIYMRAI